MLRRFFIRTLCKQLMSGIAGGYTGWHAYTSPRVAPCVDTECSTTSPHRNNYFLCKSCTNAAWFESKKSTMQSDDVARAEARKRVQSKSALPLHREMVRLHNEFKEKGGSIKVYAGKVSIQWSEDGSIVRQVTFL